MNFIREEYARVPPQSTGLILERVEADELWSFVGKKKNQVWIWLGMNALTRQVIAIHAGGHSEQDAKAFWAEVPEPYASGCDLYTDERDAYTRVIPPEAHFAGKTSLIEGVNCILRQRVSRLVRKTVAFSKQFVNHTGAMRYFISHYDQRAYEKF